MAMAVRSTARRRAPVAGFARGGIGEAHDREAGEAVGDVDLNGDAPLHGAAQRGRGDRGEHAGRTVATVAMFWCMRPRRSTGRTIGHIGAIKRPKGGAASWATVTERKKVEWVCHASHGFPT